MVSSAIASRYASALADVATGKAAGLDLQQVVRELRTFDDALRSSPELQNALTSPAVPAGRKRAVVGRLGDRLELSRITRNFLFVLVDHRRIAGLDDIIETFELIVDQRRGFTRAEISSARELADPQRAGLVSQLERLTGMHVRARFSLDESLIGGLVARIGSTVYDGSVRAQLENLGKRLSE